MILFERLEKVISVVVIEGGNSHPVATSVKTCKKVCKILSHIVMYIIEEA